MANSSRCLITQDPIQITEALSFVDTPEHGAHSHFIGTVRNHNEGKAVLGIEYEVCEPLATHTLQGLAEKVLKEFKDIKVYIAHFEGYLPIGGIGMIVSTSTPHRAETYRANRYLVEAIKHRCPVWKKEHYTDNSREWVKGCQVEYADN